MKITEQHRKAINAFARRQCDAPIYSHCESAFRTMPAATTGPESEQWLNLRWLHVDSADIGGSDLADFGPRLADLLNVEDHESGRVVVDFYVYGRQRIGAKQELDTNVQAVWQDGALVAMGAAGVVEVYDEQAYYGRAVDYGRAALGDDVERGTTLPPVDAPAAPTNRLLELAGQINELAGDDTYGLALQEIAEELKQIASQPSPLDDLNPERLHPPTDWLREQTTYDTDANVYYEPMCVDGRVGYRVASLDGDRETYLYFNPSTGSDDGVPTVFVYQGGDNDPASDGSEGYHIVPDLGPGDPAEAATRALPDHMGEV